MVTFLNDQSLTTKRSLFFIGSTAAAVCGGYLLFLGILAPQQLAEATTAATNVICNGCVGSSDIGDNGVRSVDISNTDGVRSADIVNGQVGTADIGTGQVRTGDIADNAIQPNIQREQGETSVNPNDSNFISVDCPPGTVVTGGGFVLDSDSPIIVTASYPIDSDTWQVEGFNHGTISKAMGGWAVCIEPMP